MKTNKNILNAALCALVALALPALAGGQQLKTLGGHVPQALSQFHWQSIGELPGDTNLNLAISLPVKNEAELNTLLSQIYDPASTNYHHYLNRGEFTQRFGPSASDYQKVLDFAKANKLQIVSSYSNQMLLDVQGKASDIENAFHVKLRTYHHPIENRTFFAPDTEPAVDSSVPIEHISGLDSYVIPHPLFKIAPMNSSTRGVTRPNLGSAPTGQYMGKDFRAAYAPGVALDGTGQNVALFELDGYFAADILSYETQAGLPTSITLTNIAVDGGVPQPTFFGDPEVSLDIEMVVSMATNVSEVIVYEAPNGFLTSPVDELNRIAQDDLAKQISSSWGIGDDPAFDVYYKQMALQGQSFFQASGDEGAYYVGNPESADDTNITIVGGTTLSTAGPASAWTSETVWNWWVEYGIDGGGGGGTNLNGVLIPTWQQNVPMTNNMGSTTLRNVPDVALTADNIYVVYENGQNTAGFLSGGTSCAAPLWAAYTALINQQAVNRNQPTVGFLNPAIYALGLSANYTNCFHDIATGNNTNLFSNGYFAVPGYDLASGWGTPNGSNLINALTAVPATTIFTHLSPPAPPYGSTLTVLNGGNPNGNWELFALDDQGFNYGGISNGWILTLTSANPIGLVADDGLTMTASATNVLPGSLVNFNVGIENYGPNTSSNVVVQDSLPDGFTFVTATATVGTITNLGSTLTWNVTNALANNTGALMTLSMLAPNGQGQVVNSALVTSTTPDPNPADASAEVVVNVTVPTQPLLASSTVGSGGSFHLTISNTQFPVVIQASTNMINWVNIYTNYPGSMSYTDSIKPGYPARFYRAFVQ